MIFSVTAVLVVTWTLVCAGPTPAGEFRSQAILYAVVHNEPQGTSTRESSEVVGGGPCACPSREEGLLFAQRLTGHQRINFSL